jgi:hypothetical protein
VTPALQRALDRADEVRTDIHNLIAGSYQNTEMKQRLAAAYTSLVLEHHEAISRLVRSELHGSAMALVRPVFEILFNAHWMFGCAKPSQIAKIAKGQFKFDRMDKVVKEVDAAYGTERFFQTVKKRGWRAMNSYTHSGILQLSSRFDGDSIRANYDEAALTEAVNATTIAVALMSRFLSVAGSRSEAADKANELLMKLLTDLPVPPSEDPLP